MKPLTIPQVEEAIGQPFEDWANQCHGISLAIVQSDLFAPREARVARGTCQGVGAQHSWVVVGPDCFDPKAWVVDATLWSYDQSIQGIWQGNGGFRHRPHQAGSIWDWGRPAAGNDPPIRIKGSESLSLAAQDFLHLVEPLDRRGWMMLAQAPLQGWPAAEILTAMHDDPKMTSWVPIDALGMVTWTNPGGLYLKEPEGGKP